MHKITLLLTALFLSTSLAAADKDTVGNNACLQIRGKAYTNDGRELDNINIKLYHDNQEVVVKTSKKGKFKCDLLKNAHYTIAISKPGYITRLISISTHIPSTVDPDELFLLEVDVKVPKAVKEVENFYLDFPIALISYDWKKKCFRHSKKYTQTLKKQIAAEYAKEADMKRNNASASK